MEPESIQTCVFNFMTSFTYTSSLFCQIIKIGNLRYAGKYDIVRNILYRDTLLIVSTLKYRNRLLIQSKQFSLTFDIYIRILFHMSYPDRVQSSHNILLGKPVIKGTRIPVEIILKKMSEGASIDDLLEAYVNITKEDILACLEYSAEVVASEELIET